MGRAERRRAERNKRIEERKGKFLMSHKELNNMKRDLSYDASGYITESLMTCFALALHHKGIDSDDIADCIAYINSLMDAIIAEEAVMEDYKKELEDETGIIIKSE